MKKTLALFDFDGTITRKDSFLEFIKFYHGQVNFTVGFLLYAPVLVLYKLKLIPNWKAKEMILTHFFCGEKAEVFNKKGREFSLNVIPQLVKPAALAKLKEHIKNEHTVYLVSASCENWLADWCADHKIGLIGTKLEVKEGHLTGKIDGKNCYGPEKAARIKEAIDLEQFDSICAYGDTNGDKEMLELANECYYRSFI